MRVATAERNWHSRDMGPPAKRPEGGKDATPDVLEHGRSPMSSVPGNGSRTKRSVGRFSILSRLTLALAVVGLSAGSLSTVLRLKSRGSDDTKESGQQAIVGDHSRPEVGAAPPRVAKGSSRESNSTASGSPSSNTIPRKRSPLAGSADPTPWVWENAGGEFGLTADWRKGVSMPSLQEGRNATIRGEACLTQAKHRVVVKILNQRKASAADRKVAACVRTKDFGRFLPEWIAFHYAIGVDEMSIYDDDSIDGTREILEPFIKAGIVRYTLKNIEKRLNQMKPLNDCLAHYQKRRALDRTAPSWLVFHDTDEYLFPGERSITLPRALQLRSSACCLFMKRVQYGSGGYRETPQGLTLENFLMHASETSSKENRLPKLAVNLDPSKPELGVIKTPLPSMHGVNKSDCHCVPVPLSQLRINHYLGSVGDFVDKTRRYWQENHSVDKVERYMKDRDINTHTSKAITHWACATREILARVDEGLDLETGTPNPTTYAGVE